MKTLLFILVIPIGCLLSASALVCAQQPNASAGPLTGIYSSAKHGFSFKFPDGWNVRDTTDPNGPDQIWLTIGNEPLLINVHKQKLERSTTPDKFARFNTYVQNWQRITIKGSVAFATTDGSPQSKRVMHRLIIVQSGCAWMLNCIDTTGEAAETSNKLLYDVAESIGPARPKALKAKPVVKPVAAHAVKPIAKPIVNVRQIPAPRTAPVSIAAPPTKKPAPIQKKTTVPSEVISVTEIKAKP